MAELKILLASSEVVGFAKTGGLADVAGSLPRALAARGHQVAVVMPLHRSARLGSQPLEETIHTVPVPIGNRLLACRLYRSTLPKSDVPIYLIDAPEYFDRDDSHLGMGLYQQTMPGGYKADYPDNAERFAFFCRAVLEMVPSLGFIPDVIHSNDWQTGLVPPMLSGLFRDRPGYTKIKSLFTIHNIAYQGMFPRNVLHITGLPGWMFNPKQLEFHGQLNFLKAGIVFANGVNTVSPTYAKEIQTHEYGCGLEGVLQANGHKVTGIVNGVDYGVWDPEHDPHLPEQYNVETVFRNKPASKRELQKLFNLPQDADRPILGMVARLVSQKGIDLVMGAAPGFLDLGCQIVILGEGDPEFHNEIEQFRSQHPNQVGAYLGFHEPLAHLVEAGSDFFLMPSRYEPSGLNQLYSLKYGTLPIVRATGGLADTIVNASQENILAGIGTGFTFGDYTPSALYDTVKWAVSLFYDRQKDFRSVVRHAMKQDWSWSRSAADYESLYQAIMRE